MELGTKIYYTGDMANQDGMFTVCNIRDAQSVDLQEIDGNRLLRGVFTHHIGNEYHGHCNPRFVTAEARNAYRQAAMQQYHGGLELKNKQLLDALIAIREAVISNPAMQGREYIGIGIMVNEAILKAKA